MAWKLTDAELDEIGSRFEAACLIALDRARRTSSGGKEAMTRYLGARAGIRVAMTDELLGRGCPKHDVGRLADEIVARRCALRIAEGLRAEPGGAATVH